MHDPEFETEWQEYQELINDLKYTECPRCKENAQIFFNSGRRAELLEMTLDKIKRGNI